MVILENIDIDIDKAILQNIDIDKISNRFKFGISNRASVSQSTLVDWPGCTFHSTPKKVEKCISWTNIRFFGTAQT